MDNAQRRTSPWVFVGIGCLLSVLLIVAVVVGIGVWGFNTIRELERTMEDPAARTELAAEFLATEQIPDGYHTVVALSIPFLMETVVLTDKEPDENGRIEGFGERGFIYFKTLTVGEQEQELRDFFEGRTDNSELLDQTSVRIDTREVMGRGVIEEDARTLRWVSYRGEIGDRRSREFGEGLTSMVLFECADERVRMGIWFGPDPDPDAAPQEAELAGSVADPAEIGSFLADFDVCRR